MLMKACLMSSAASSPHSHIWKLAVITSDKCSQKKPQKLFTKMAETEIQQHPLLMEASLASLLCSVYLLCCHLSSRHCLLLLLLIES